MKYPTILLLLLALSACKSTPKEAKKVENQYIAALYFRYISDTQESTLEFIPTQSDKDGLPSPISFDDGVFYNGGTLEDKSGAKQMHNYTVTRKDEFPANIHIEIKDLLDYTIKTPILKNFSARKDGNKVLIDTETQLSSEDQIIVVLFDATGKDYTEKLVGAIQLPYTITIPDNTLTEPISVSAIYQKRMTHQSNNFSVNTLLEYYTYDIAL